MSRVPECGDRAPKAGPGGGLRVDGGYNPALLTPSVQVSLFSLIIMQMKSPEIRYHRSAQREAILELIQADRKSHLTAEEVFARLKINHPRLSVGTVYRNLHVLAAQGAIRALHMGTGSDIYDGRTDPHYHLVCKRCGDISDIDGMVMADLETEAAKRSGSFQVENHSVEFYGLCGWCTRANS